MERLGIETIIGIPSNFNNYFNRVINIDNYYLILVKPKGLYATYDQTPLNYLYTIYIQLNRMQHFALHFGHRG